MRILFSLCVLLAGCGGPGLPTGTPPKGEPEPTAAELEAEQARLMKVSEIAERNDEEVERLIKEAQAGGIEKELRAAVGRLTIASNARLVEEGDLSAATWFEQQVTGKTPAEIIAAFPEK